LTSESNETPLTKVLSVEEASWVGSLLALGALFGTLLFGWLSQKIGRFWASLLTALPEFVSFLRENFLKKKNKKKLFSSCGG
jgi:MFS family permease